MSLIRVLRTAQTTLTRTVEADGVAVDSTTTPTVAATRLDGTAVVSGNAADAPGTGVYTFVLPGGPTAPASATWQLDALDATWTGTFGGALVTLPPDRVEVVGGFYFGLAEARAAHDGLADETVYPWALLAEKRVEVEQEIEAVCRQAFVPRFARHVLSGTGAVRLPIPQDLPHRMLRAVRAVSVDGTAWDAGDVAAVTWTSAGVLHRPGGAIWPAGHRNIVVEYEHGADLPPEGVRAAGILLLRSRVSATTSGVPDRAISFTAAEGGTYRLSTPSRQRFGIPEVDGPLERYTRQRRAVFA